MASNGDGAPGADETATGPRPEPADDTGAVDRWTALDRGWQALALGLGVVAVHLAGQAL